MGLSIIHTAEKFEFKKSKMADGRHFENRKIARLIALTEVRR